MYNMDLIHNIKTNEFSINFNNQIKIDIDNEQFARFFNKNKQWKIDNTNEYPYYLNNGKQINILQFLYKYKINGLNFKFKNGDNHDLRKINTIIVHKMDKLIKQNFDIVSYQNGHYDSIGSTAYIMKNPWWISKSSYITCCNMDTIIKIPTYVFNEFKDYENENNLELTWCKTTNNIITTSPYCDLIKTFKKFIKVYDLINNQIIQRKEKIVKPKAIKQKKVKSKIELVNVKQKKNKPIKEITFKISKKIKNTFSAYLEKYDATMVYEGYYRTNGCSAYVIKNPIWITNDNGVNNTYIMHCGTDIYCLLCKKSLEIIRDFEKNNNIRLTWHKSGSGYIQGNPLKIYMHQVIMNLYNQGQGTKNLSVDHIDRNPLNNKYDNLRIATMKQQQQNSKGCIEGTKRARKKNAKSLPEGITQEMMPKYVVYYKERSYIKGRTKENDSHREFFKIEKHPLLKPTKSGKKIWIGSKSMKIPILEKLEQVKQKLEEINV